MNFSSTLKYLREVNNVTQDQLAKHLQVSRPTVAGYETKNRQPDFEKLIMIAEYFHVSLDYLISGSEASAVELLSVPKVSEKMLDYNAISAYRTLSLESKQDVLHYIELLQLRDNTKKTK